MSTLVVTEVGTQLERRIEAPNDYHAVAEAAGCAVNDVPIPIWEGEPERHPLAGDRPRYAVRCYMPRDNSGRQWLVRDGSEA